MALYVTNSYQLEADTPEDVLEKYRAALVEFVDYVRREQPDTWMYTVLEDPTRPYTFVHFAVYKDKAARDEHTSDPEPRKVKSLIKGRLVDPPGFVAMEYSVVASHPVFSKT